MVETNDAMQLEKFTAVINIRGLLDGLLFMSYNETMVINMARAYHNLEFNDEMDYEILGDVTAETSNIVLGNSLKLLESLQDLFIFGTPTVLFESASVVRQSGVPIYNCSIKSNSNKVMIGFLPL